MKNKQEIENLREDTRSLLQSKFGNIIFEEVPHRYTIDGVEYTPVSNVISQYENPFDEKGISKNYAEKHGLTQEEVLRSWKYTNRCATIMGTRSHEFGESYTNLMCGHEELITEQNKPQFVEEEKWLIPTFPQEFAVKKFYDEKHKNLYPIGAEFKLSTQHIEGAKPICGTADLLFYYDAPNEKDSGFVIGDWKGLDVNTPIYTTNGWKTMGSVKIGDTVFDKDGEQCKVLHTSEVHYRKCYKITFDNQDEIVCDNEHRWLITPQNEKECVMTAEEMFEYFQKHPYKKNTKYALTIKNNKPLKTGGVAYTEEVMEARRNCVLDLNDFTPYSFAIDLPIKDRYLLLGKIMDKYDCYDSETNSFILFVRFEECRNLLCVLLSSLGIKPITYRKRERYVVKFKCNYNPLMPKTLKVLQIDEGDTSNYRTIVKIEEVETIPTRCVEVDSKTHTFLCGTNFLVTHNTNRELTKDYVRNNEIKMLPPFDNLYDEALSHYYVQFNLYQRMMESVGLNIIARRLIHLRNDGTYQVHTVPKIDDKIINQVIKDK